MLRGALATTCLLAACTSPLEGEGTPEPFPFPFPEPDPGPRPGTISVTLDNLQPGWRVTTSRLVERNMPDERTIESDGSPITLFGTPTDVFVATVTDAAGNLVATHAMKAPCTLASGRRLDVPGDYPTIQGAIDEADPGDTVRVAAGTYTESVQLRPGVCLLGSGARRTILDAGGERRTLVDLTDAPGSVVSGFTMRGVAQATGCATPSDPFACSGNWYTAGVYLGPVDIPAWDDPTIDAPPIITNNVFEGNDIGVMLYHHGIAVVRNNVFARNRIGFVANHYQDRTLVANNVFDDNTELAIGNQAAYLDIIDNIIVGSQLGIRFKYIQTGHIACNVFFGNGANANEDRFQIGSNGNVEAEPKFVGSGDYHLQLGSPGKDKGCHKSKVFEPDGSLPDIGAFGGPLAAWADL
ncbi:MAG TPA: NosD domain-containing protein [Kofleriaceae bacterium]|nr:NosD domain-containing protein [Kofleriaceae bacterium]